jgi:hypothetical protein
VFLSLWTDEEVDSRSEVYVRRLGTAECTHFLAENSKQKTSLQLGLSEACIALKKFRVGELISTGTGTLKSCNAFETHKMKSSHVDFSIRNSDHWKKRAVKNSNIIIIIIIIIIITMIIS